MRFLTPATGFPRRFAALLLAAAPVPSFASGYADLPDPALVLAGLKASRPAAFAPASRPLLLADPADRADVDALWARVQDSPLGRELSAAFVSRGRPVRVAFEDMGTTVHGEGLDGPQGWSDFESQTFLIHLSSLHRQARWRDEGAATLAHELLGHCDRYQALPADLSTSTYHHYAGDETYAGLVGWTVSLELGSRSSAREALELAGNRSTVESRRRFTTLAYAQALSLSEMSSPAETYAARWDDAARERAGNAGNIALSDFLADAAEHFVAVHGEDPARYAALRASLASKRATLAASDERFANVESWLGRLAVRHSDGGPETAALRAAASHPYLAEMERRIAALSARVRALARPPESAAVPSGEAPASTDVDQGEILSKMKADAKVHPEFWTAAAARLPR